MNFQQLMIARKARSQTIVEAFGTGMPGYSDVARHSGRPGYEQQLAEAQKFINTMTMRDFYEAMSTSDFPLLFGDSIDRKMYTKFKSLPGVWRNYVKVDNTIPDMRAVKRFRATRGDGTLSDVPQGDSYPADSIGESTYSYSLGKKGKRRNFLWEALQNDDLGALHDTPDDFAFQAANTEANFASSLFVGNTTLYSTTHSVQGTNYANLATSTPLTPANLAAAISVMGDYPGDDGSSPVLNEPLFLVVGTKNMEFTALQILNSITVAYDSIGDTDTLRPNLPTANIVPSRITSSLQVLRDPWMRTNDSTNVATSWYLFSDPNNGWAIEMGFLNGHETPELFMKNSNQVLLGGGMTSPMDGDFDNDAVAYKVRHIMGGSHTNAVGGWRFTYWAHNT